MTHYLRDYVTKISGPCESSDLTDRFELRDRDDAIAFRGPLSLNVSVEVDNVFSPLPGVRAGGTRTVPADLYSYDVDIPAGHTWSFELAHSYAQGTLPAASKVVIRAHPCPRPPGVLPSDVPCDFAVGNLPECGHIFPVACEPCGDHPVRMPPTCGPALTVFPAHGGCVRPRFFNGMFVAREDMETQLRYFRVKNQLQRRADGQGVVWGLGLGRDGRSVCVHPGYAVDCCGNDLTVTCTYKVDVAGLLADPAICHHRHGRRQCFSLLLEYVECPEEPRPVHGEHCVGGTTACEMSRVRETVRLRLVPQREYKASEPIHRFLQSLCEPRPRPDCRPDEPRHREAFPCLTDPCCGDGPRFPLPMPWCDEDPFRPGQAGSPKAIALAIVYALLAGTIAHEERNEAEPNPKVQAAADLLHLTARLVDPKLGDKDRLDEVAVAMQQLLSDWCCSLLYPGPCCEGELHGVVIGCAVVCGDEIERIDPWGGRRWVMHYPLQSYWGAQFGVVPPDILASRVFGMICCLAGLERPSCEGLGSRGEPMREAMFGAAKLGVREAGRAAGHHRITRRDVVPVFEFARRVLAAMAQEEVPPGAAMVEVQPEGFSDLYLLVPDQAPEVEDKLVPYERAPDRTPSRAPTPPARGWVEALVQEGLVVPRVRRMHRGMPLLRGFIERLSIRLALILPVTVLAPPAELAEPLEEAGIDTLGALLDQTPERLAADMGDAVPGRLLSELVQRGESRVLAVTETAVERVQAVAGPRGVVSAAELAASVEARTELVENLAERLQLPREAVEQLVAAALP
jgi:hypothetical protein